MIPLFKPSYGLREKELVSKALDSGWTGLGPMTEEFEAKFAAHLGVKHAIMTNSCTSALKIALASHRIGPGSRVMVPTMTFTATAHVVRDLGAEVVLRDVYADTLLGRFPEYVAWADAYIPVLLAGQYVLPPVRGVCVYDCAHAVGSSFGARGRICCWSFHAVKNLSCGEGGAVTTDDADLAQRLRKLRWLGIDKSTHERAKQQLYSWQYEVDWPGYKAHGNDLAAAVGIAQLERLSEMQAKRKAIWDRYRDELPSLVRWADGHSYLLAVLRSSRRDALGDHLSSRGIQWGVHYRPLHTTRAYAGAGPFEVADSEWPQLLTLPLFPDMTEAQQDEVIQAVKEFDE